MDYDDTIEESFKKYIGNNYDQALYDHTLRVAHNSAKITDSLLLNATQKKLAFTIAIVHELGRFKNQDTMDLLFKEGIIRNFIAEPIYDDIIRDIIYSYNTNGYSDYYSETAKILLKVLNDSDKLDQLYQDSQSIKIEGIQTSKVSGLIIKDFGNNKEGHSKDIKSPVDSIIVHLSYIFSLNFKYSFCLIEQEKYVEKIITNLHLTDQKHISLFEQLNLILTKYITEKIGEAYHGW